MMISMVVMAIFQMLSSVNGFAVSTDPKNSFNPWNYMHDEYYDDTDADYHTTDYIPKMSFDHHEKWHGNEHA